MTEWLVVHEPAVRLTAAAAVAGVFALAEQLYPRRSRSQPRMPRWRANAGILLIDTLALRFLMPVLAVGMALEAERRGWGVLNQVAWPEWIEFVLTLLLLDLVIYGQHRTFHKVPVLWRLHRVHHSDLDFDVSTGLRFHPIEILLSMGLKIAVVAVLGAPAAAVVVFEVLLNGITLFNHANLGLPARVDQWLRLVVVTPDMHRVHHSVHRYETDSNYGFSFPCWDRLFRTYRAQPVDGHERMVIGVVSLRDLHRQGLVDLLWQPFTRNPAAATRDES